MGLATTRKSQSFAGEVVWDKDTFRRRLRFFSESYLRHFLNTKLNVGDKVSITITNHKPKRTESQNRYYWGAYLPIIAEETGEDDLEALHELFKGMFLTKTIREVLGKKVRITRSTTDLSISEFIEFIQKIEVFTGIQAPPTENYFLQPIHG